MRATLDGEPRHGVWSGAGRDGNFDTAANWEDGRVPAAGENIVTNLPPSSMSGNRPSALDHQLSKGECVTFLPIGRSDWVEVRYSIDDNFKGDGKWERKLYRLGRRLASLAELMPQVNHHRLLKAREVQP